MELSSINTPTVLTLIRLVISPLFLPIGLVYFLPYKNPAINILLAIFFILLSLTDFFDGYLARKYKQETTLGKALDPLADKFLFFSALIALLTIHRISFFWVILFIGREFFVMGIRILALEQGLEVPVSWLGKFKTAAQMVYVTLVILSCHSYYFTFLPGLLVYLEDGFLMLALFLSLISAYAYYKNFRDKIQLKGFDSF